MKHDFISTVYTVSSRVCLFVRLSWNNFVISTDLHQIYQWDLRAYKNNV